jgi:hypothetical protein
MLYRSFMEKYRPLYAPDDSAAAASDSPAAAASPGNADAGAAAPAQAEGSPSATEAAAAPAATNEVPAAEPSLLEAADATKPAEGTTESPAPAETAAADGDKSPDAKDAKTEGKGDEKKADAEKDAPKDAAKTDPDQKDATADSEPPAPIKYEAFTLPDGVKFDDERLGKFTEVAGKAQIPQDVAQSLVSLHVEEMQRYAKQVEQQATQHQQDVWRKLNDTWKSDFRKDPELGGNRAETTLARAKAVIEEFGGTPEQVRDLIAHTSTNGMGNFPGFIRMLNNIGEALSVFEDSEVPANPAPPRAKGSRGERWYGGTMGNGKA